MKARAELVKLLKLRDEMLLAKLARLEHEKEQQAHLLAAQKHHAFELLRSDQLALLRGALARHERYMLNGQKIGEDLTRALCQARKDYGENAIRLTMLGDAPK